MCCVILPHVAADGFTFTVDFPERVFRELSRQRHAAAAQPAAGPSISPAQPPSGSVPAPAPLAPVVAPAPGPMNPALSPVTAPTRLPRPRRRGHLHRRPKFKPLIRRRQRQRPVRAPHCHDTNTMLLHFFFPCAERCATYEYDRFCRLGSSCATVLAQDGPSSSPSSLHFQLCFAADLQLQ